MSKNKECAFKKSSVGGQALIEGVMMRGPEMEAMAVRLSNGEIDLEKWKPTPKNIFNKIPIIRGIVNFVQTLMLGYKCLAKSAEKSGLDEVEENYEPSRFEKFINEKFGDKLMSIIIVLGAVLGVAFAIALFMLVPSVVVKGINYLVPLGGFMSLIEGIIKIVIFVVYLALVAKMKDIRRVFEYHGAEHKTIFCYEKDLPLTVENVKQQKRFHPRCGTSFLVIILIISILIFSLPIVPWDNLLLRTGLKLLLLPIVLGIAYEFIKLAGRHNNILTRIISWPGVQVQHLTTKEPDDSQIEVAIASLIPCLSAEERERLAPNWKEPEKSLEDNEVKEAANEQ